VSGYGLTILQVMGGGGRELNAHCCCSSWLLKMSLPFSHLVLFSSLSFFCVIDKGF
jgi:hypothetical protein